MYCITSHVTLVNIQHSSNMLLPHFLYSYLATVVTLVTLGGTKVSLNKKKNIWLFVWILRQIKRYFCFELLILQKITTIM